MPCRERPARKLSTSFPARLPRILGVLLVCPAIALVLGGEALADQPSKAPASETYTPMERIGPAKRVAKGLLRVKLNDAETVLTHGLDPEQQAAAGEQPLDAAGPERRPVCASDHYQHVLYGRPSDSTDRLASVKATILSEIKRMDALLNAEALASGGLNADYKVKCDGAGEVQVDTFQSAETSAQTTFAGVLNAARRAGFDDPNVDYTIFFDSSAPRACGTGTYSDDQRLTADNFNNAGGDYAVTYSDCWTNLTAMHENGHNQGAVQYDAPFSTGTGGHCNDDYDVMCYSDGGNLDVGMSVFCADKVHFDCRYDTYFDTAPEPGEYLESNWNLGSPLNRFVTLTDVVPAVNIPPVAVAPAAVAPAAALPAAVASLTVLPAPPPAQPVIRALPTLTMPAARRYAQRRITRRYRRASQIRTTCSRKTRTSAACRVRWKVGRRASYRASMVVRYRFTQGRVATVASVRLRRIG